VKLKSLILPGLLLLLAQGCTTDVVDFKPSASDLYADGCKMEVVSFGLRCMVCQNDGSADMSINKDNCAKLGCQLVDAYTDCKICWWSDKPSYECFICSNKTGIYKDTCHPETPGKGS
jgi:hypothetical protein